jgi:hypothetical protein
MKSPSLDAFYNKFDKHILLAQGYTEIKELSFIIKSCRFKPYDGDIIKNTKLILHREWIDEFGNSFSISDKKKLQIKFNDLSLNHNKIICTDLYNGLSIEKIIKISKLAYIFAGKDEDLLEDCCIIALLGIDNYLRVYSYIYGEWKQIAPILLGFNNLKSIWKYMAVTNFLELKIKDDMPIPCVSAQAWITYMPASDKFLQMLDKQHDAVSSILTRRINI